MSKKEIEFWDMTFAKMVKTKEWKQILQTYMWEDFYMNSRDTSRFLDEENKKYEKLLEIY